MVKKSILAGAIFLFSLATQPVYEAVPSVYLEQRESGLERTIQKINENIDKSIERIRIFTEEKELLEKDEIYRTIDSFYKTQILYITYLGKEESLIPEYLTKKFVRSLIRVESEDKPRAKSIANARGLGQIIESTWYEVEKDNYLKNVFIPERNVRATIKCLLRIDYICRSLHPNWSNLTNKEKINLIAAAYNGGIGRLQKRDWNISKMPEETKKYIPKIHEISKEFIPSAEIYQSVF